MSAGYSAHQLLADWDNDGNDDVLLRHVASGTLHVFRAVGEGFAAAQDRFGNLVTAFPGILQ